MSRVIRHPDYNEKTKANDVALLELSSPVELTNHIRPVCLAEGESVFPDGLSCWITGWGDPLTGGEGHFLMCCYSCVKGPNTALSFI